MRTITIISIVVCFLFLFSGCKKDSDDDIKTNGLIKFMTYNPLATVNKNSSSLKLISPNPPLTGPTTITETTSLKFCVGDVWVSQGEVKDGESNSLDWVRLTSFTNTEAKLFEDYTFEVIEIPVGSYKSVKITFRNVFHRYVKLVSDPSVTYELLETMGSWTSVCDINDTSWAKINYFGPDGNHILGENNLFELVQPGEKLGGFNIDSDNTTILTWRLGAGATTPCLTLLIDQNSNLIWDCGIDRMEFECPPENKYMWDFMVEYE